MGTYTLDVFRDGLQFELGQRTDVKSPTNWYTTWINTAYIGLTTSHLLPEIGKVFVFPELMVDNAGATTTTDGTAYITTPTDALYVEYLWDSTHDRLLKWMSWDDYMNTSGRADTNAEGDPTRYTRRGTKIYLSPTPGTTGDVLYVYYRKRPHVLDGSTYNTTVLSDEWDEPILKLALIQSLRRLKEYDFAEMEKKAWVEDVAGKIRIYGREELNRDANFQVDKQYLEGGRAR